MVLSVYGERRLLMMEGVDIYLLTGVDISSGVDIYLLSGVDINLSSAQNQIDQGYIEMDIFRFG